MILLYALMPLYPMDLVLDKIAFIFDAYKRTTKVEMEVNIKLESV